MDRERTSGTSGEGNGLLARIWVILDAERAAARDTLHETERTQALLAVFVIAPLIGAVTAASNSFDGVPFLMFPPLAAATYRLFAYPERQRPYPWDYVLALSIGAVSGWVAILVARTFFQPVPSGAFQLDPVTATLSVAIPGVVLWALDIEMPPAYAVGLLLPFAGVTPAVYATNVVLASALMGFVFTLWRYEFHRA